MRFFAVVLAFLLLGACAKPSDAPAIKSGQDARADEQYKKEIDEIRKDLKGDLKIKLKRDGKSDFYSWEIDGKDAGEVLRANDVLIKKLGAAAPTKRDEESASAPGARSRRRSEERDKTTD